MTSTDSATTERAPPGPASRATVTSRCRNRTARSRTAESYQDGRAKNAHEFGIRHGQPPAVGNNDARERRKIAVVETFTQSDLSGIAIRSEVCPREEEQSGPSVGERELPAVGDLLAQLLDDLIDLHIWID